MRKISLIKAKITMTTPALNMIGLMILNLFLLASCNYKMNKVGAIDASSFGIGTNSASEQKALGVLATNCSSCHGGSTGSGGVSNILNVPSLLSAGLIVPGSPSTSPLFVAIQAGRMPPSGPLSASDQAIIRDWIAGGQSTNVSPVPGSTPTGTIAPPSVVSGTLEAQAVSILQNKCYACHGTTANGGLDRINDPAHVISIGFIVPGSATTSKIYDSILNNRMPLGGPSLAPADKTIIMDWINQGAKTPASGTVTPPPATIPLGPTFASLQANVLTPKCVGCHSSTNASGGIKLDTYTNVLRYVNKTTPTQSKIYTVTNSGEMPPQPNPVLGSAEETAILDWIKGGALNN